MPNCSLQLCCKLSLMFFQFLLILIFVHNAVYSILSIYLTVDLLESLFIHAHFQFFNDILGFFIAFILDKPLLLSSWLICGK